MAIVFVNLGSNLGSRRSLIQQAIDQISVHFGYYCLSEFVESEPWGFDSTNFFLNVGLAFTTDLNPEQVLHILQNIEREISLVCHRDEKGGYKDREIDIDIMAIDDINFKSPILSLPHPHLYDRDFFIKPLRELIEGTKFKDSY